MGVGILRKLKDAGQAVVRGAKKVASVAKPAARAVISAVDKHRDTIQAAGDMLGYGPQTRIATQSIGRVGQRLQPILK